MRTVSNFFEHSRRYSQIKVDHRFQRHRHLKKGYSLHVLTASVGVGERDTHAVHVQTAGSEKFKSDLKVVSSEKVGGSGVTSALGTWYRGVVMGVLLSFDEAAIL
jgi:hypothetical protein